MGKTSIQLSPDLIRMLENCSDPKILASILQEWAQLYRAEMLERFERLTRGGGEWPYLKHVRPRNRKNGTTDPRQQDILWDEGFLVGSLQPEFQRAEMNGGRQQIDGSEITIGFAKAVKHRHSQLTVQDIADKHQSGDGVPIRQILVPPSDELKETMIQWAMDSFMEGKPQ